MASLRLSLTALRDVWFLTEAIDMIKGFNEFKADRVSGIVEEEGFSKAEEGQRTFQGRKSFLWHCDESIMLTI